MRPRIATSSTRNRRLRRCCATVGIAGIAAISSTGTAGASDRTESFGPVKKTDHALVFRLRGVEPNRVVEARAKLHGRGHRLERRVSTSRVRSVASRRGLLRVSTPRFVGGGKLKLKLVEPQDPAAAASNCAGVDAATLTAPGCNVLRDDSASVADPVAGLWGNIECAADSRHAYMTAGGDVSSTASGTAQGNDAYRRLTVIDGDDFWGERCELGRNTSRYGENKGSATSGTFALYQHGERRITFFSQRYPENFSSGNLWQTVMQMKQAQPADNAGRGPVLELQLYNGRLELQNSWREAWSTSAPAEGTWIRYALDVVYSPDPAVGSVQVYVDLNGDGDAADEGEQSPKLNMATQLVESSGPNGASDGLAAGDAIPDHLRLGLYHSPEIACPPPGGCSVDVDNVQVVG